MMRFGRWSVVGLAVCVGFGARAGGPPAKDEVEAILVQAAPLPGGEIEPGWSASNSVRLDAEEIARAREVTLPRVLAARVAGVHVNDAQNNPLQPDLQYRGYTASPLLGLPQGLAIYQDGMRLNEPFGDAVNWDLIPDGAIADVELLPGSDPLFGLNALGGALALRAKDGFAYPCHRIEVTGGSFGRLDVALESGASRGPLAYHAVLQDFRESGWRDESDSSASRFHARTSWRSEQTGLDFSFGWAGTDLRGNGPSPVELLERERDDVFTYPDVTRNHLQSYGLQLQHELGERLLLTGLAYYRALRTRGFNGDASEFVACQDPANAGLLCEDDDALGSAAEEPILDDQGSAVSDDFDAIENRGQTAQAALGFGLQAAREHEPFGRPATLLFGLALDRGDARHESSVGIAELSPDRGTTGNGRTVPEERVRMRSERGAWSAYASERVFLRDDLMLQLSGRVSATRIELRDRGGITPELDGTHRFSRLDPGLGLTWRPNDALAIFAAHRRSSRAPTPIELACADADAPCSLPNSFLADPPLDEVVTGTWEVGMRGGDPAVLHWSATAFSMRNADDILFVSTGGVTSNEGYFENVSDTRRVGLELSLRGLVGALEWRADYGHVRAEFRDAFAAPSANHPLADAEGQIHVVRGDWIPGIPRHVFKLSGDFSLGTQLRLGFDVLAQSSQVLRGDEANLLEPASSWVTLGLRGEWRVSSRLRLELRLDNLFDREYENFGVLGDPEEVLGPGFEDPRFLGPGAPRGLWLGAELEL